MIVKVKAWANEFLPEITVAALNIGNVALGFILQIAILRYVGVSREADAYFAASAILTVGLSVATHVVAGAITPHLARLDAASRIHTTWRLLKIIVSWTLPVAVFWALTASFWVRRLFPGLVDGPIQEAQVLASAAVLTIPFAVASALLSAYLYAERRFVRSEAIALGGSAFLCAAAPFAITLGGIEALGYLLFMRFVGQLLVLLSSLPRAPSTEQRPELNALLGRCLPLILGALYFKSDVLIDRYLLSSADAGALSIVALGQTILLAASGVLGQALASTALPGLSIAHNLLDGASFRALLRRNLAILGLAAIAILLASAFAIAPLVSSVISNAPDKGAIDLQTVLLLLAGLPIGACIGALLANAFYALHDTRTPTIMTAITFTVFVVLKFIVFNNFGVYGFCALISIYYIINGAVLAAILHFRLNRVFA